MVPGRALGGSLGVLGRPLGVLRRVGRVPGVSLNPLVAHGTSLWDPRGALGGPPGATEPIDTHYVVTMLAVFGP